MYTLSFIIPIREFLKGCIWIINTLTIRKQAKHAPCPRLHLSSLHIISMQSFSVPSSPCFLLLCVYPSPPPHSPSHHPGQPMWSEWRLIQGVRSCLKCNKLPLGSGTPHPSRHITRAPPSLTTHTHAQRNNPGPLIPPPHSVPLSSQPALAWLLCHPSSCAPVRIISIVRNGSGKRPAETWVEVH